MLAVLARVRIVGARPAGCRRCGAASHRLTTVTLSGRVIVDTSDAKVKVGDASALARRPESLTSAVGDTRIPGREG